MKGLIDTNILIEYLQGDSRAKKELSAYSHPAISLITWMEVLIGAANQEDEALVRSFLSRFLVVEINQEIGEAAISLRRTHRMKLPDAIIWATAQTLGYIFVTRNTKDFPKDHPGIRVPY